MNQAAQALPLSALAGLPRNAEGPVFAAPWQAQAFALVVSLHQRGAFTWSEWATALSHAIAQAQAQGDADLGDTYYQHWLEALETLLIEKGLAAHTQIHAMEAAWAAAAARTPHGQAIVLTPQERAIAGA
jgi:nitrile hydratase accessory protein